MTYSQSQIFTWENVYLRKGLEQQEHCLIPTRTKEMFHTIVATVSISCVLHPVVLKVSDFKIT